ncbi:MAG TPA: hypothetical protein VEK73_19025 [Xanthobacteraceae bacterium]|nr:hypothetical protein [Xanthobacteraceae bacterium]
MCGLRLGLVLAACGPLAAAAQAPPATKNRSAWAACQQAPTRVCLIGAAVSIAASTGDMSVVLEVIGKAQARAGQKDQAAATFRRALADTQRPGLEQIRASLTAGIAWAQSESGFAADAEATFALAAKLAAASGDVKQLEAVAVVEANAGDIAAALQLARSINDTDSVSTVLRYVVAAYIKAGRTADAAQFAQGIANQSVRAEAVALVVRALADSGKLADAEPLAAAIGGGRFRAAALADIAAAHAKAGRKDAATTGFARAASLARSIAEPMMRLWALADVARAQARAGLAAEAAQSLAQAGVVARAIAPPVQRAAIFQVAYAYSDIGAFADAVAIARSLDDQPPLRSIALMTIVKAEANAGRIAEAVELAQSIPMVQFRAIALAETALALPQ